jgi:hypothetical protein
MENSDKLSIHNFLGVGQYAASDLRHFIQCLDGSFFRIRMLGVIWGRYHWQSGRPAGRISARRAQHVPAGDGGGAVRAHLDSSLDLLDAMPALRGESRQRRVVTPVSSPLRLYPDENV